MNFQQILDEHHIYYRTEGQYTRAGWIQLKCPFCTGGSDPNKLYCGYSLDSGAVSCWRCGKHRALDTLVALTGQSYKTLRDLYERPVGRIDPELKASGSLKWPKRIGPLLPCHIQYLRERKFNVATLEKLWYLRGVGISTELAYRIVIPIDLYGQTVSWTTRAIVDDVASRYISAKPEQEAVSHKLLLYGEDYARNAIIVLEGPTDVWRVGPGAVASFGTMWTFQQVNRLLSYPIRYICFDNEPEAQKRAKKMQDALIGFDGKTEIVEIDAPDPGSAKSKEIKRLRRLLE